MLLHDDGWVTDCASAGFRAAPTGAQQKMATAILILIYEFDGATGAFSRAESPLLGTYSVMPRQRQLLLIATPINATKAERWFSRAFLLHNFGAKSGLGLPLRG
jgi:hypothetical protein